MWYLAILVAKEIDSKNPKTHRNVFYIKLVDMAVHRRATYTCELTKVADLRIKQYLLESYGIPSLYAS